MAPSVKAIVKPELLIWARESAGLSMTEAARKAIVKPEKLTAWEMGEDRPTVNQLRKLAEIYKRPLAVFYLPNPPKSFDALRDFRRLPQMAVKAESPQLRFEMRRAHYRREVAIELHEALEGTVPDFTLTAGLSENPENLAERIRAALGITPQIQFRWREDSVAYGAWRAALERAGALVFQTSGVELTEMRGFSISDTPLPVIVVNNKDAVPGRIFSMLHEFTHVLLRMGGLCNMDEEVSPRAEEQRLEVFCSRVAGAVLAPMELLLDEAVIKAKGRYPFFSDGEITALAKKYHAGREVLLRRLLIGGRTTEQFYQLKRSQFQKEFESRGRTGGFVTPDVKVVNNAGQHYLALVLSSYHQEKITASDLSDYLDIRLKHLPKIEKAMIRRHIPLGA